MDSRYAIRIERGLQGKYILSRLYCLKCWVDMYLKYFFISLELVAGVI